MIQKLKNNLGHREEELKVSNISNLLNVLKTKHQKQRINDMLCGLGLISHMKSSINSPLHALRAYGSQFEC